MDGLRSVTSCNITEYPDKVNVLRRFNLYPEVKVLDNFKFRVANLEYWTPHLAILDSFCGPGLPKFCHGVFPNLTYFLASFRTSKISTFSYFYICR